MLKYSCLVAVVVAAACGATPDGGGPDVGSNPAQGGDGDRSESPGAGNADTDSPAPSDGGPLPGDGGQLPGDGGPLPGDGGNPADSVPANPVPFVKGEALRLGGDRPYYVLAPLAYDETHQTPTMLFVYLHGCGGASSDDVYAASNYWDATWLGMAPGDSPLCWQEQENPERIVMDAIADMKTHFNVDPKRIHIGGYSSGGDLSYATALANAGTFAAILSYNSIPTYENADLPALAAAATWKLNVVHLSQTEDLVYPIADVRIQMQMLRDAGFPVVHIERPGPHIDENTTMYRNTLVYPYLSSGFRAP